jgi:TonB family protein
VSSLSGADTSVAISSNGYQSNGYRFESAPTSSKASAPRTVAGSPAPQPAPPQVRAMGEGSAAPPAASVVRSARAGLPVDRRIYSAADEGVQPPSMVRLQMPSEPRSDSEVGDSWVELVIDERGEVAQVRLHSSKPSLNDRMIVAAAKAWQFQPALKDGIPVKYILRLPVTR